MDVPHCKLVVPLNELDESLAGRFVIKSMHVDVIPSRGIAYVEFTRTFLDPGGVRDKFNERPCFSGARLNDIWNNMDHYPLLSPEAFMMLPWADLERVQWVKVVDSEDRYLHFFFPNGLGVMMYK